MEESEQEVVVNSPQIVTNSNIPEEENMGEGTIRNEENSITIINEQNEFRENNENIGNNENNENNENNINTNTNNTNNNNRAQNIEIVRLQEGDFTKESDIRELEDGKLEVKITYLPYRRPPQTLQPRGCLEKLQKYLGYIAYRNFQLFVFLSRFKAMRWFKLIFCLIILFQIYLWMDPTNIVAFTLLMIINIIGDSLKFRKDWSSQTITAIYFIGFEVYVFICLFLIAYASFRQDNDEIVHQGIWYGLLILYLILNENAIIVFEIIFELLFICQPFIGLGKYYKQQLNYNLRVVVPVIDRVFTSLRRAQVIESQDENMEEYTDCAICLDELKSTTKLIGLECHPNHIFHQECIVEWISRQSPICPLCKSDIK